MSTDATVVLAGVIAIAIGIVFCFFGYRVFRIVLAVLGFAIGATVAWTAVAQYYSQEFWILVLSGLVGGLIGAVLLVLVYYLGLFLAGAWLGALLALVISTQLGYEPNWIILAIAAGVGGIVALLLQKVVIVISTALGGAGNIVWGASLLVAPQLSAFMLPADYPTWLEAAQHPSRDLSLTLLCWLGLAVLGMIVQFSVTARHAAAAPPQAPPVTHG